MQLEAGAASRDLTPAGPVPLCGYPHVPRVSRGVHDPLLVSVLFLRRGPSAVLLGALDLLMLNTDFARQLRRKVAGALKMPEACVLLSCTHTHSGPVTLDYLPWQGDPAMPPPDPNCLSFIEEQVVEAAREAKRRARPAALGWTQADARGVGGNRLRAEGPTDPAAGVLAVQVDGRPIAVAVSYGMHPTVLHEDSALVSSDFPGYARRQLQEELGHDLVVLYHTGPAGDQSPRHFVQAQTFAEAERLGRRLGKAVLARLPGLQCRGDIVLAGAIQAVALPRRTLPSPIEAEQALAAARARYDQLQRQGQGGAARRTAEVDVFGAEGAVRLAQAQAEGEIDRRLARYAPFEVQALRIGDACLAAFPGELFVEYGLRLKAAAPMRSFPIAYANGELQGYIVTPAAAAAGGYEAASGLFEPAAGGVLVDAAVALIRGLMSQDL